jgi:hypothetical protein
VFGFLPFACFSRRARADASCKQSPSKPSALTPFGEKLIQRTVSIAGDKK